MSEMADTPEFGWGINRLDGLGVAIDMTRVLFEVDLCDGGGSSGMTKGSEYLEVWDSTTCCQCASSSFVESFSIGRWNHKTAELCYVREAHTEFIHKDDPFLEFGP